MKALIVYASKFGFTEKCAQLLAKKLNGHVDIYNVKEPLPLKFEDYQKIIIGSSIYMGKIHREMRQFCNDHLQAILKLDIGLFITGAQEGLTLKNEMIENFPIEIREKSRVVGYFGYAFDFDKMNFIERMIINNVARISQNETHLLEDNIDKLAQVMNQLEGEAIAPNHAGLGQEV